VCNTCDRHAQTGSGQSTKFTASIVQRLKNSYTQFQACGYALKLCTIRTNIRPQHKVGPFLKSTHI